MKEEFQFATVAKWYEKQFGKPLVFYSPNEKRRKYSAKNYAIPASGKVMQGFQKMVKVYLSKQLQMQQLSQ